MSNALIAVSESEAAFREKIKDRIFNNLADIIPEERFLAMVDEAVKQSMLTPQDGPPDYYGNRGPVKPSYLCELVKAEVNKLLTEKIEKWFAENAAKLEEHFRVAATEQIGATLVATMMSLVQSPLLRAQEELRVNLQTLAMKAGVELIF